ncbi:TPR-like protein [Rhizophagus irregularis]|uniref:TPR-like protein n=1 Tax=Rhizophagus irregularis TaxID=588596 RepID=A0A2N1MY73_9GLOM|nr:TPR-like protein [Rhizophagus irregularis]
MEGSSSQSKSSSTNTTSITSITSITTSDNLENNNNSFSYKNKMILYENMFKNRILIKLEEDGFITSDDKVEELIKNLTKPSYLYALKLIFENLQNDFSSQILANSLEALVDTPFNHYSKESLARLELHLKNFGYEIHCKTTQVFEIGVDNNFRSNFNLFNQQNNNQDEKVAIKKRNYNIDFLLIHLRDTLHSLRDDETWFQEIIRRTKDFIKAALNITPGILSITGVTLPNDNCSILSLLIQVRQSLSFKYPVASYYIDWRIMLIIQHNIFIWSESSEKIISKKLGELVLMEYIWSFLEREWVNAEDKSVLDSQTKFDEVSNKVAKTLKNAGSLLNDLAGNEPIALPHILWFGLLDLAQNLIQRSSRIATYGLCYYLAIESLNKAPSSFIQFKSIELLEKYHEDSKILSNNTEKGKEGKGKSLNQNSYLKKEQISNSNILDVIAGEITCPINIEPMDQLYILKCQHMLALNNLIKLKQKICPNCREKIEDDDIRYLPQDSIYKNLYTKFFESGHILPSIELENSHQQLYDSDDSDDSEVDLILNKKKKFMNSIIKLNSKISSSILSKITKKQHPIYQNIIKEINDKHYEKAETLCKEFLNLFPKSYSLRCILAYIYRCLDNYKQAHLYLEEAIDLNPKRPVAYFICGEIHFRQNNYFKAINYLEESLYYKAKLNNLYIILGNSCLLYDNYYEYAIENYNIALKNDPNNHLCLKNCAYRYEKKGDNINALKMLDKLLSIDEKNSLILCYYGEILCKMVQYSKAILYFTKANIIDPENIHNLSKRAIAYCIVQEYDKALSDLNIIIQLDPLNSLAYYLKSLTYYMKNDINNAKISFKKCVALTNSDNRLAKIQLYHLEYLLNKNSSKDLNNILTKINQISNISENELLLLLIRCKIHIELNKYYEAKVDLDILFNLSIKYEYCYEAISYLHLLQKHSDFWSYLYETCEIDKCDYTKFGIADEFSKYMYKEKKVYFISNLTNLNSELCQFQENDISSLSGLVLSFKNEKLRLDLPILMNFGVGILTCKMNIKKILNKDCFIKFINNDEYMQKKHMLNYYDLVNLEGLGWIEHQILICIKYDSQLSIEINSIDMEIDYVCLRENCYRTISLIPNMSLVDYLLPNYPKNCPNVPETFKDKYFSRKQMENLLDLKDILNSLYNLKIF